MRRQHLLVPLSLVTLSFAASAQTYERVDVSTLGSVASDAATEGRISADGRYVAFVSTDAHLAPGDVPSTQDVFLRDRELGTTIRVTTPQSGVTRTLGGISLDGNKIAYGEGGGAWFVYDRTAATTTPIAVGLSNVVVNGLDRDGTYAVVTSGSFFTQVYRVHLATNTVLLCSRDANGNAVGGAQPAIDGDGSHVCFQSASSAIVIGDTNGVPDVFVFDIPGASIQRASIASDGIQANGASFSPSISEDGRFVSFLTFASNLGVPASIGVARGFVRDLRLETTTCTSLDTIQVPFAAATTMQRLSPGGRHVAIESGETIGAGDATNGTTLDVFARDLESGVTRPGSPGSPVANTTIHGLSFDARYVLVSSSQAGITGAPDTTVTGLYVADFGLPCSTTGYCTALPNSTGAPASIGAMGEASRELDNLVIAAVGMPDTAIALLYSGTTAIDPGTPFGNGLQCVGGTLVRRSVQQAIGGVLIDAQHVTSPSYADVHPGDTRYYQVLYRDPDAGGAGFNTTDAVAVTFCW